MKTEHKQPTHYRGFFQTSPETPKPAPDKPRSSAKHLKSHTSESNYRRLSKRWKMLTTRGIALCSCGLLVFCFQLLFNPLLANATTSVGCLPGVNAAVSRPRPFFSLPRLISLFRFAYVQEPPFRYRPDHVVRYAHEGLRSNRQVPLPRQPSNRDSSLACEVF